ncbi:sensor histidine kinase [Photobacterium indicum]
MIQWQKLNFRRRLLIIMTMSGLLELLILSALGFSYIKKWESQDLGEKAIGVAEYIANTPSIITAVEQKDPQLLAEGVERFRQAIGAAFIVIGDNNGIRLAHPIDERVGLPMRGGDNIRALTEGKSYISYAKGSMGHSVRGKTAVFDNRGEIIGVVSVGYLLTGIHDKLLPFLTFLLAMAIVVVGANGLLANLLAKRFQRTLLGFEPEEIGRLYAEKDATMSTLREGVLSIDNQGILRSINRSACGMLGIDADRALNRPLSESLPESSLERLLLTGQSEHDIELYFNSRAVIANREPLFQNGVLVGAVSSFRLKDEITELNRQLSQVTQYAELLRAQTHEHRNKLNTIAGLVQLGAYSDVFKLIGQENQHYETLIKFLRSAIAEPLIAGLLLGKSERARELGLRLVIDSESCLSTLPEHIVPEDLVTILGNLIDNAFDATLAAHSTGTSIHLHLSDYGNDLILEVEDSGIGLPEGMSRDDLVQRGVSTKEGDNHGVGLYLINQIVSRYNGQYMMENRESAGARMTVYLPKTASIR